MFIDVINNEINNSSRLANVLERAESGAMRVEAFRSGIHLSFLILAVGFVELLAESKETITSDGKAVTTKSSRSLLFKQFEETLTNARMVGQFTFVGKDVPPLKESYTIHSVKKMSQGDYWIFNARIKYGKTDITLPMPLQVKWAEGKPVIYLDNVTIPGLGTFSSYTVIDGNKYAGTWQHGDVGGHMFGTIERDDTKSSVSSGVKKTK